MDKLLIAADNALRTLFARPHAAQPSPARGLPEGDLSPTQRREAGALMRVNHVGEVCAQALYMGQAAVTRDPALRARLLEAAREETDHLAWTAERLDALGSRPSLLNPLWFAGAFAIGWTAAQVSDAASLGFVVETENQVARHLQGHLDRMPAQDAPSLAVIERMQADEQRHADDARAAGATALPAPARMLMAAAARVMTATAHHI
ncbi:MULTISPECIES: 2-polyprenyl-3-methyl-6-methoxy-1,4-benzoquinone monooxygenase [Comamonadaceae]|uniref:2-polyprenyl-3-methyl-6-methoxy-1,4-benzoquinone monooxygenase n=1 Tax=Acidovorax sacchari TaxID=3230736 RepID=UPI0034A32E2D